MSQRPAVVFFDMNVWVAMAKGLVAKDARWQALVDNLRSLVGTGRLRVALCPCTYLELWHRRDQTSREDIGRLIRDLSDYATFAPIDTVRKLEVEAFVHRHVGRQRNVSADELLGRGATHAFGSRFGRFRFVESIASADGATPEGRAAPAPDNWLDLTLEGPAWEWFNLVGTQEVLEVDGLERTPQHRIGNTRVEGELRLRELLATQGWAKARLRDLIITDEIETLTTAINQACWDAHTQPHGLFMENPMFESPAAGMRAFVEGLPSVDALATLREWKHRDLNHEWDQHDQGDLLSLAVAIPYADIVVTERRWAHICRVSGLSQRYSTRVCALRDLDDVVHGLMEDSSS